MHSVFVWEEGSEHGVAFRLKPGNRFFIERASVPVGELERFKRRAGPSLEQIERWFSLKMLAADITDIGHEFDFESPSNGLRNHPSEKEMRSYRINTTPSWAVVLDAIRTLGRPVSSNEVGDHIVARIPDFERGNLGLDLSVLSVNCFSRGNHAVNRTARRTDTGNTYDKLIRLGEGDGVRFALYDPDIHGVWELVDVGERNLRPRFLYDADFVELEQSRQAAVSEGKFDLSEDNRRRTMAAIVLREGQPAFRQALLAAYGKTCSLSGCTVEALLEAAHIVPYRGAQTNLVGNGLLLRADLHKMFDLHLFRIDPLTRKVHLSNVLKTSEYAHFDGTILREPFDRSDRPLAEALRHHEERCAWMNASALGATLIE
ncbi:HNH endonuclease [Janthinobacterium sp. FW305-128]|uniref:HNH endonuclease n=1 Tax=Janthinobacterium sp. FW305-128 TaxID=2775055 RepID=UPI001E35CDD6|nr:HNH endonuclease [Janthinobacterium sp. FW305-128]